MKKGEKMGPTKVWEKLILKGEVKAENATLEETKRKGMAASPALVDILLRVLKRPVEDPVKYTFPDEKTAQLFKTALSRQLVSMNKVEEIHVSRCECTVYLYRKDTPVTS